MQFRRRNSRPLIYFVFLAAVFAPHIGCAKKTPPKPTLPDDLSEFYAPVAGELPYFKGVDMNPYWAKDTARLPADLHRLTQFTFITHTGDTLKPENLRGKLVLMSFFFTRCSGICPMVAANIKRMRASIGNPKNLVFVSVSVDPDHDRPRQLDTFRRRILAKGDTNKKSPFSHWYFVTGDKAEIYTLARDVFQSDVTVRGTKDNADFLHTESVYLLDKNLYLRGIYRTKGLADKERLKNDVALLSKSLGGNSL